MAEKKNSHAMRTAGEGRRDDITNQECFPTILKSSTNKHQQFHDNKNNALAND